MTEITKESLMAGLFGYAEPLTETSSFDSTGEKNTLPLSELHPSPKNPYKVKNDEDMEELVASIKENGILVPLIVRKSENGYEIIAGHRRRMAALKAGLTEVPVMIMELTDEQADIIMVDSNLNRPHISISEKAFAYKLKYDAIKKSVGRNWDTKSNCEPSSQLENTSAEFNCEPSSQLKSSAATIAQQMGVSDRTIQQYIRLTFLDEKLLELVDDKELNIKTGVQLSYIPLRVQDYIHAAIAIEKVKIDEVKAKELRAEYEDKPDATIDEVLAFLKPKEEVSQPKPKSSVVKLSKSARKKFFPANIPDEDVNTIVSNLLDIWARKHNPEYEGYEGE